ncbi:MAG: hypothetical protein KF861_18935 [Planctomycetaceae bacterium]|nr:hypothetical protein [Planctomycetaceae bacterium]
MKRLMLITLTVMLLGMTSMSSTAEAQRWNRAYRPYNQWGYRPYWGGPRGGYYYSPGYYRGPRYGYGAGYGYPVRPYGYGYGYRGGFATPGFSIYW